MLIAFSTWSFIAEGALDEFSVLWFCRGLNAWLKGHGLIAKYTHSSTCQYLIQRIY